MSLSNYDIHNSVDGATSQFPAHIVIDFSLFLSLAEAFPLARFSLAVFISFGADVRTCLIWVGTRSLPCLVIDFCKDISQGAVKVGTDSSRESNDESPGAVF